MCSPPPRDKANQEAVWQGLTTGVFDVFSSDHAGYRYAIRKDETWPQRTVQKGGEWRSGPRGADRTSVFGSRRQGAHRSADIRRGLAARSLSVNAIPARQPRRTHNALEGGATYMQSVLAGFVLLLYKLLNSLDIFPSSGKSTISRFLSANARTSDCSRCNSLAASRISSCLRVGVLSANARTSDCSRCNSLAASRISSCLHRRGNRAGRTMLLRGVLPICSLCSQASCFCVRGAKPAAV